MTGALGLFTAGRWSVFRCHASCEHSARMGKPQHRQAFGFGLGPVVFGYFQSRNRLASTRPASGPSSRPTQRRKEREPFEAELLVLFGLPAIIILIPWALGDPSGLLIIPLVLLIPGPRDIILAVVRDSYIKMRKAKRFIKNEPALGHFEENSATNRHVYPKRRIKVCLILKYQVFHVAWLFI